eukprot:TRINITY_DN10732_c0_g1_i1.p1 TRINITY_DN10732_c0_g1~~TRINITY_DN10732_c0_g1_i1.p1  ORF type:complete len:775 (+),score=221.90 TRINITY_DN10732_c0_g1_i1:51-2327(+)
MADDGPASPVGEDTSATGSGAGLCEMSPQRSEISAGAPPLKTQGGSWRQPVRVKSPERKDEGERAPWSPVGHSPSKTDPYGVGFGPACATFEDRGSRKRGQPMITELAQKREPRGAKEASEALYRHHREQIVRRKERVEQACTAPGATFSPKISSRAQKRQTREPDTFSFLYQQRELRETRVQELTEKRQHTIESETPFRPSISQPARKVAARGDMVRFLEAAKREQRLSEKREKAEAQLLATEPPHKPKITELPRGLQRPPGEEREATVVRREHRKVEDRLLALGTLSRDKVRRKREEEEDRCRKQASPSVRRLGTAPPAQESAADACERLFRAGGGHRGSDAGQNEPAEEVYSFSPQISRRSRRLAGENVSESVEARLLRQGEERRARQLELVQMLESEGASKRRSHSAGRVRGRFADPIGVLNPRVQEELTAKHGHDVTFRPYIGENSRVIDRQIRGAGGWRERVMGLYHAHYSKELRLERLRDEQDRQEQLLCQPIRKESKARAESPGQADVHQRGQAWQEQIQRRLSWRRQHSADDAARECTFEPSINTRSRSMAQRSSGYGPQLRSTSPASRSQSAAHCAAPTSLPSPRGDSYAQRHAVEITHRRPQASPQRPVYTGVPRASPRAASPTHPAYVQAPLVLATRLPRGSPRPPVSRTHSVGSGPPEGPHQLRSQSPRRLASPFRESATMSPPAPPADRPWSPASAARVNFAGAEICSEDSEMEQERLELLRQIDFHRAAILHERQAAGQAHAR